MAHKLHELLTEDQEPFHLKTYISDRRSQLNKPSPTTKPNSLQIRKRKPIIEISTKRSNNNNLCRHACFLSFQNSPDAKKSPFFDFSSPAKSPCKSPNAAVFLHIPSRTAALLVEAAMKIQKHHQPQSKPGKSVVRFGLFGSLLKRLKDRSMSKKRAIKSEGFSASVENGDEVIRVSCSCSNRRISSADWTETNEDRSLDFETSTSISCGYSECDFGSSEERFCSSPFVFNLQKSPSSFGGGCTPEICSPASSPCRRVKQGKEKYESRNSNNSQGEGEEKEQSSPVSVLDPPFEDDGREIADAEECDYDMESGYENVQRAKQQLLNRLRRFEKLAELDPIELERKLMEGSDDEENFGERQDQYSEIEEPQSLYKKQGTLETFVTQVFTQSSPKSMSNDMKRLVSDLIVEEKNTTEIINDVVMGRIRNRLDSWKEVEFDTIDMMIGLDFKREFDGWCKFPEQVQDTAAEIELAICRVLVEELSEELFYMDGHHQELEDYVSNE